MSAGRRRKENEFRAEGRTLAKARTKENKVNADHSAWSREVDLQVNLFPSHSEALFKHWDLPPGSVCLGQGPEKLNFYYIPRLC